LLLHNIAFFPTERTIQLARLCMVTWAGEAGYVTALPMGLQAASCLGRLDSSQGGNRMSAGGMHIDSTLRPVQDKFAIRN
jgi:hypothetical protein